MAISGKSAKSLNYTEFDSPLGKIVLGEYNGKICLVEFKGSTRAKSSLNFLSKHYGTDIKKNENQVLSNAKKQFGQYFSGKLSKFTLPLDYAGTEFQEAIWKQLSKIPYGKTVNYGWVAEKAGNPKAARAAGAAIGDNRISIIVPCHRVVGKDGSLTGYGGGLKKKEWLLAHERTN